MNDLDRLAALLREHNQIGEQISAVIGRPALTGHLGEFIASRVFEIELERSANATGYDGRFRDGDLIGRTVNVKCYLKLETLDINPKSIPDFYLVLSGPRSSAMNSRGATRPFVISHVFLFDANELCDTLRTRNIKLSTGTSLRRELWDAGELYPENRSSRYTLSDAQRSTLALFAPDV
jgi:hypothetical protein